MTLLEWNMYINGISRDFSKTGYSKRSDIRKFLRQQNYSKEARNFVKSYSGTGKPTTNISVNKTIDRLSKKVRRNKSELGKILRDLDAGDNRKALRYIKSYTNELRSRARTVQDADELAKTKNELKRMITLNKQIRAAKVGELQDILNKSVKNINDIQFQKAIRSSVSAQVKTVARTEKSKAVNGKFYKDIIEKSTESSLFDVVLSSNHIHYDECDIIANNGPYTKDELPALPIHVNCQCRYRRHSKATEKSIDKRSNVTNVNDRQKEFAKEASNKKAKDNF